MGHCTLTRRLPLLWAVGTAVSAPGYLASQEVVEVQVSPQVLNLSVGDRERLFFSAFDARGNLADAPVFQLTTSDAGVARVDSDGTVTGIAVGRATLVVRSGTGSASVSVRVGQPSATPARRAGDSQAVDRIIVSPPPSPDPVPLGVGSTMRFHVRILGPDSLVPPAVSWALSDPAVATFDPDTRTLRATAPGDAELTARVAGVAELRWRIHVASITLSLPHVVTLTLGETDRLDAVLSSDVPDIPLPSIAPTWSSDDPSVVAVDSVGVVRAAGLGRATVTARAGASSASTTVYVVGDLVVTLWGRDERGRGLYQVDLTTGRLTPLLVDSASNVYAARSPSRNAVAFASDRDGLFHVYTMLPDGSDVTRLTGVPGHQTQPVWTAGQALLYTGTDSRTPQLYELASRGSKPRQLTFSDTASHSPVVSRDDRVIAFVRGTGSGDRVYLMDRDGSNVRSAALAEPGRFERAPRFFPNGDLGAVVQIGAKASAIVRWDRERDQRLPLVTSDGIIQSFAVSGDGRWLAAVVESSSRNPAGKAQLLLVDLESRQSRSVTLDVPPGTQLSHPSF